MIPLQGVDEVLNPTFARSLVFLIPSLGSSGIENPSKSQNQGEKYPSQGGKYPSQGYRIPLALPLCVQYRPGWDHLSRQQSRLGITVPIARKSNPTQGFAPHHNAPETHFHPTRQQKNNSSASSLLIATPMACNASTPVLTDFQGCSRCLLFGSLI